jgi:hypothetical protein
LRVDGSENGGFFAIEPQRLEFTSGDAWFAWPAREKKPETDNFLSIECGPCDGPPPELLMGDPFNGVNSIGIKRAVVGVSSSIMG